MNIASVALVTIGQSPRSDLAARFESIIPDSVEVRQAGLLDGMSQAEIEAEYVVQPGEMPLVTRLRTGHVIAISSTRAREAMQDLVDRLTAEGVGMVVLLCTGQFRELRTGSSLVLQPDTIVPAVAIALMPGARIGVILPMQEQIGAEPGKWETSGSMPLFTAASPYDGNSRALAAAGRELVAAGARSIVLDCMGFDDTHERVLAAEVDVPVILSNKVMVGVLASLF